MTERRASAPRSSSSNSTMLRIDESDFWDPSDDSFKAFGLQNGTDDDIMSVSSENTPRLAEHTLLLERMESEDAFEDAMDDHDQWYGKPLSAEKVVELFPSASKQGLIWKAEVIPDQWWEQKDGDELKPIKGLNPRDFNMETRRIKAHRGAMPLTQSDLLTSITVTPDGRYIFHGSLNGWPQLRVLELISLERKFPLPFKKAQYKPFWNPCKGLLVFDDEQPNVYRACFRGPGWTGRGWSEASLGYGFWFEALRPEGPRLSYGTNMLHTLSAEEKVSKVHMISHRYAKSSKESPRDKLTYHSIVLLEWDHGNFCTVVEGAYLNGIGGYKGKSNWQEDMGEDKTILSQYIPDEMIGPWFTTAIETRCYDVPEKNLDEFKDYLERHKGHDARFVDPQVTFSHVARLTFRTKRDLAQYLLNYVGRDFSYQTIRNNCQTLTADLCAFLAGKRNVEPFHPTVQMQYRNRTHQFLYDSSMYD